MDPVAFILILVVLIAVVAVALAVVSERQNPGKRGSAPGSGHHELHSRYTSGVGGGHERSWKVPRDPQEYAKLFIPKDSRK
ncbi:hypothetical protein [Pacificoceanicola onchidii]|uniref:hypothetical protein n=1 Tax=Pacificoceanicola onchidii TaxID=2562685 RepID=UPI0010A580B9|nr:hypothetical protein [Pacificoceanicola onchidii]